MGYRGHAVVTFLLFVIVSLFARLGGVSWVTLGTGGLCMALGGLFPDIDTASRGRRLFTLVILMVAFACLGAMHYGTAVVLLATVLAPSLARHRTLFHNIYFLALLALIFWWVSLLFFPGRWMGALVCVAFFLLGCWGHLVADFGFMRSLDNRF